MVSGDETTRRFTRRETLAGGVCALVGALAGCTRVSEFIADRLTGEVNLFNTADERLAGSLELVDPAGQAVLDEQVDLAPTSGGTEREPAAIYEGVLETAGPHRLTLDINVVDGTGGASTAETVEIAEPGDQKIVVLLGGEFTESFLFVSVVSDFAELDDEIEGL